MESDTTHHLPLGDGLELTLSSTPPGPALFRIMMVMEGLGGWRSGEKNSPMRPGSPWWVGREATNQRWESEPPSRARWFCLSGTQCPLPELSEAFERFVKIDEPRCCAAAASDAQELAAILTDCPYSCPLKTLLARGKSLMLVSKTLYTLESAEEGSTYKVRFFRQDLDKVAEARELLLGRMDNPPGLAELARSVGLNELKLKAGFRRLWGTTVYGLLRRERLGEARRLLATGEFNVGEAAFRVGYINTSHFARAFQKEFGVAPSTLARSLSDLGFRDERTELSRIK